ncbi:MAG: glutathione peroxidase [Oscillospiraceae bacterium]|nr:glutathione peroxidase [Oscillospiraceae bacterium]
MSLYDFKAKTIKGKEVSLSDFKGKLVLVVNTASKCGFTPQYEGLEKLYQNYKDRGLVILGFPCNQFLEQDPGSNDEISSFCKVNYGVTFPLFSKIDVNGPKADPLYTWLKGKTSFQGFELDKEMGKVIYGVIQKHYPKNLTGDGIKWNFTKFLIGRDGESVRRFEPTVTPKELEAVVKAAL